MGREKQALMGRVLALLVVGLQGLAGSAAAQVLVVQEKADVEFRTLALPFQPDDHSGVYWRYTAHDPLDLVNHLVIEMLGGGTNGIVTTTLKDFVETSTYYGAYTLQNRLLTREERVRIAATARRLKDRTVPAPIIYIDDAIFAYVRYNDLNQDFMMQENEITRMRSDAFTEFCYTESVAPIVTIQGESIVSDPGIFNVEAAFQRLLPSTQRAALAAAPVDVPVIEVRDSAGTPIPSGGASPTQTISVMVRDDFSGPGRLELWEGAVNFGTRLAVNDDDFDAIQHVYTAVDANLSMFSNMPEGNYTIRAIDQAGNNTSVGRNIADPHFLVGDETLIFSESAISKGRNPAFSGIHHSESHSRSITARGHLAGGQA